MRSGLFIYFRERLTHARVRHVPFVATRLINSHCNTTAGERNENFAFFPMYADVQIPK
jgi:hypothetical protein